MLLGRKAIGTVAYLGGVPAVLEPFCWSWGQMVQHNQELFCDGQQYIHYDRATFSDHAPARNGLVARFLGEWLVQMDTDHAFDPDIVARLVRLADEAQVDVLSALYQMKGNPHGPVLFQWFGEGEEQGLQPMSTWPKEAKLLQIGSAGAGCLFVRRSVFDTLAALGGGAFDHLPPFSEDHSFFLRCKRAGIECFAAMNIHSHHLRIAPVEMGHYHPEGMSISDLFPVKGFS